MTRSGVLFICLSFFPTIAFAHTGHWGEVAGHDHILAGAAIGIAIAIGIAGALKGRGKRDAEAEEEAEADPDLSEA